MQNHDELDTQVFVKIDGPFGEVTVASGLMRMSEAAMTATHYPVGSMAGKILNVQLVSNSTQARK